MKWSRQRAYAAFVALGICVLLFPANHRVGGSGSWSSILAGGLLIAWQVALGRHVSWICFGLRRRSRMAFAGNCVSMSGWERGND